jgi:hypothetical protein
VAETVQNTSKLIKNNLIITITTIIKLFKLSVEMNFYLAGLGVELQSHDHHK